MINPMVFQRKTVALVSLGCAKAQVDAEVGLGKLLQEGYSYLPEPEGAELVVVNTCGFIAPAVEEAVEEIEGVLSLKREGRVGRVIVAGCLVDRLGDLLKERFPEVDQFYSSREFRSWLKPRRMRAPRPRGPELPRAEDPRLLLTPRGYAYMKIAEGCDRRCAFCTIPSIRGRQRSRTLEDLLAEGETLAGMGVKELILVSQDTVRWGRDLTPRRTFIELLQALEEAPHLPPWIRLHYLYPEPFPPEVFRALGEGRRILPYVDLPIQHASDTILARMRRGYRQRELKELWEQFRRVNPDLVLRTTIIVGHPGEGEKEFAELKEFLEAYPFEWVGVFPYYAEEGTPSATQDGRVPEEVCRARVEEIQGLCEGISRKLLERFLGRTFPVLVDGRDPDTGEWVGRMFAHSPGVDGQVILAGYAGPPGRFVSATLQELSWPDVRGRAQVPSFLRFLPQERSCV